VEACIAEGLVGGEGFAVDASLIVADANKQRSIPGKEWDRKRDAEAASRAVLATLALFRKMWAGSYYQRRPRQPTLRHPT
jgi:hypothetical protein